MTTAELLAAAASVRTALQQAGFTDVEITDEPTEENPSVVVCGFVSVAGRQEPISLTIAEV